MADEKRGRGPSPAAQPVTRIAQQALQTSSQTPAPSIPKPVPATVQSVQQTPQPPPVPSAQTPSIAVALPPTKLGTPFDYKMPKPRIHNRPGQGRPTALTDAEEGALLTFIAVIQKEGLPWGRSTIKSFADETRARRGAKPVSESWMKMFMRRYPQFQGGSHNVCAGMAKDAMAARRWLERSVEQNRARNGGVFRPVRYMATEVRISEGASASASASAMAGSEMTGVELCEFEGGQSFSEDRFTPTPAASLRDEASASGVEDEGERGTSEAQTQVSTPAQLLNAGGSPASRSGEQSHEGGASNTEDE